MINLFVKICIDGVCTVKQKICTIKMSIYIIITSLSMNNFSILKTKRVTSDSNIGIFI